MKPTIGRIVSYKLGIGDVNAIANQRLATGAVSGTFNVAREGDVYPAMVVRVFDPSVTTANLKVFLDGGDTYWATSRTEGDDEGHWLWPERTP